MIDAELNRICAGQCRGFAHSQLSRVVLLELSGRAHAVVTQANGNWGSLLPHLECAMPEFRKIRDRNIHPGVFDAVGGIRDKFAVGIRRDHCW